MTSLQTYVDAWSDSCRAVIGLAGELRPDDWDRPSDCPGWSVHDILAHLAALEHELAYDTVEPEAEVVDEAGRVTAAYTQLGVDARADRTPSQLVTELDDAVSVRADRLRDLPSDPSAQPPHTPGGIGWDWPTLLRNRAIDAWVHEQDIRRAVGRAGRMDAPGARVTTETFTAGMGYVLGKQVAPPAGTTVVWRVRGAVPFELALTVGEDERARPTDSVPDDPSATLGMDNETFTILAAGRHPRTGVPVELGGDPKVCGTVLARMSVTP